MPATIIDLRAAENLRDIVHQAVQTLSEGGLAVLPTETVYGLAARALDPDAVQRLLETKGRRSGHPLALAIKSAEEAQDYVPDMGPLADRLARRCWPGPVTLVMDNSHPDSAVTQLAPSVQAVVSPNKSIGLRVPGHQLVLDVLRMVPGPLVLTSANRTGEPAATNAQQAVRSLADRVQLIIDDGPARFGKASSVVHVKKDGYQILRAGVVPEKTIRRLAAAMVLFVCTGNTCRSPMAEALCRKLLAARLGCPPDELEERGIVLASAGVAAMSGGRSSPEAVQVMADMGVDLSAHQTQPVTERLVRYADLVLTMTHSHRQAILMQWPQAAGRTALLSPDGVDIPDPIGGTIEQYRDCARQIQAALEARLDELLSAMHN